jgi:SAM-dependent methyltransferase
MNWEQSVQWLRRQPDKHDLVIDSYYDDPLVEAARRYNASPEWLAVRELLPKQPGLHALDVGAGRGIASFALSTEGFQVTALEPDGSALVGAQAIRTLAREEHLSINVVQSVSERLPFDDAHFDLVFGRAVLHHTLDLPASCREFFRVLKPGGTFVALREHVISKPQDLNDFLESHPLHFLYGGENAFVLDQYVKSIEGAGFCMDAVLMPLRSPINLAPYTQASFQIELARRASFGWSKLARALAAMLAIPSCWTLARFILERIDHRAGRLYSFVAHRPK